MILQIIDGIVRFPVAPKANTSGRAAPPRALRTIVTEELLKQLLISLIFLFDNAMNI